MELTTDTLLTVTPALATLTVAPAMKFVPVRVTGTLAPCVPLEGLMFDRVGAGVLMVNDTGELLPLEVDTVTLVAPVAALAAMAKVAVI